VCHAPTENRTLRCAYGAHAVLVLSTGRLYFLFFPLAKQQEPQICVDGQERFQLWRMHVQPTKPGKNLWVDPHHMVTSFGRTLFSEPRIPIVDGDNTQP
jgi:hypothetical protein